MILMELVPEIFDLSGMPERVFHYTNITALYGIVEKGSFWSTDFRYLNDAEEVINLFKIASPDNIELIDRIYESPEQTTYGSVYTVLSFSECCDNLAMWGRYSNDEGINIGVTKSIVKKLKSKEDPYQKPIIGKCIYDTNKKIEIIKRIASSSKDESSLIDMLFMVAPFLKNNSFMLEEEWRIVTKYKLCAEAGYGKPSFRLSGNKIIPYVNIEVFSENKVKKLLFDNITLSSKIARDRNSKNMVNDYLECREVQFSEIKISTSSVI